MSHLQVYGIPVSDTHHWVDALIGQIILCRGVVLHNLSILCVEALADPVDLQRGGG